MASVCGPVAAHTNPGPTVAIKSRNRKITFNIL